MVGPAWVGDMVMAQSLFLALAARHPHQPLDVLAPAWTRPLLQRMPQVSQAIPMPLGHGQLGLGTRYRLGRQLRGAGYRQAIVLPGSFKSALVPWWARIPRRTGYHGEMRYGLLNDRRPLDKSVLRRTVERFVALAQEPGEALPPSIESPRLLQDPESARTTLDGLSLSVEGGRPVLALCPGAEYGPAKRWPVEHFITLGRHFIAQGWQVWLFGSQQDQAVAAPIARELGTTACQDLTGRTLLHQALDLLGLARVVVSNDSGLMHVAAALDRPLVALYGSSDPGFTPPLHPQAQILSLNLPCSPCFRRECPLGHLNCLRELEPGRVIEAVEAAVP